MKHERLKLAPPHVREIIYAEPFALARRLKGAKALTLLESVQRHEHLGRYSFLAAAPRQTLVVEKGVARLDGVAQAEAPLAVVQRLLDGNALAHVAGLPPFQGGLAGYIAYEFGRSLEPKARIPDFPALAPDMVLHVYDTVIGIDHMQERAWIFARHAAEGEALEKALKAKPQATGHHVVEGFASNLPRTAYEAAVRATVEDILAGDIFQANITQCFSAARPPDFDPFAFYQVLRRKNPATFAALLDYDGAQVISSSPERLVKFDGVTAEARPIKGTRRRDADPQRDAALITELQASRKDRAENVMIVDLLRNDLSRVCRPGTVKVPVLCGLESYANVHHLVSVVQGDLRPGLHLTDLIAAVFPGGSITGAPKIRAMEIIAEREQMARGVYCGAIGYMGFSGHSDFNIAIRTVQATPDHIHVQGGGGITAKSQAPAEYEESLTKIARIMEAFAP
ncbi:MAG: aminodeoxychorismate synthase component I [Proteobacteria bacterium]|nr:aminodeoxychorismate synthase component I [Pseudomonadota bacterium]